MAYDEKDLIDSARRFLKRVEEAEDDLRRDEQMDLKFVVGKQWNQKTYDDRTKAARPRPALTLNILANPVNRVVNEIRQAKPSIHISPQDNEATKETADVKEGLIRHIQYDSDAETAVDNAAFYQVACGRGGWRMDPEWDEDSQRNVIKINEIEDYSTVYWDPASKKVDKSDARKCLVTIVISRDEFRERFPDAESSGNDFAAASDMQRKWIDPYGDREHVMIAEWWTVERDERDDMAIAESLRAREWPDRSKLPDEFRPPKPAPGKYRVVMHLIDGVEELQPPEYRPGRHIPIYEARGNTVIVDGKKHIVSLVRNSRDPQQLLNWTATNKAETLALVPRAPRLVTPRMIQGHETEWQNANNSLDPYLLINPDPAAPSIAGQRDVAEPPVQALSQAMLQDQQFVKDTMGIQDPALGKAQYAGQSGIAVQKLRTGSDEGTFHFGDNLGRALKRNGRDLVDWIDYYYDTEQEVAILGEDMREEVVKINTPAPYLDPRTQLPRHHEMGKGRYAVRVSVGPSYATKREESGEFYSSVIQAQPEALDVIGDLMFANSDIAGASAAADRWKRYIAIKIPGLIPPEGQDGLPPQVSAQMAQMQAQIQQMTQALQQAGLIIHTKQIEQQGRIEVEREKGKVQLATAAIAAHAKLADVAATHRHSMFKTQIESHMKAIQHTLDLMQESELAPGPDSGSQGIHPTAIPPPKANGSAD